MIRFLALIVSLSLLAPSLEAATTFLEAGTDSTQGLEFYPTTNAINGTIASASDQSHTGTRSIKSNVTVSDATSVAYVRTADATVRDAGSRVSIWVRFSNTTPATAFMFMSPIQITATSNNAVIGIGLTTTGKLRICGRGDTAVDGTTTLSANTWYRVSTSWLITSVSVWSAKVWLNGTLEATTGNAQGNLAVNATSRMVFGANASASVDTFGQVPVGTVWVDDIYIDNGTGVDDPGNIFVTAKRPNANGTSNQFVTQIGSGGSGYGSGHSPQVNEQPLSTTNGWSFSNTTRNTEEYNIESAATGDADISAATIVDYMGWIYANVNSTADTPVHRIIVNNVATSKTMTTSAAFYSAIAGSASYPPGTGTDIGMDAQYTTNPHLTSLLESGIVIAYIPAAASAATTCIAPFCGVIGIGGTSD